MGTWTGRKASSRTRAIVFIALGTVVLSTYSLFRLQASRTQLDVDLARNPLPSAPVQAPQPNKSDTNSQPPAYPELKVAELALPQHDKGLAFPEGKNAKFVRFGNQMWGVGLNNQLFEILLNTEIARRSGRAYVFTPFIWDPYAPADAYADTTASNTLAPQGNKRAARVPLRAYIESPTSGAPWPEGDSTPRAVSDMWYDRMCPQEKRLQIDARKINKEIGLDPEKDEGVTIVNKWATYLRNLNVQCVNLQWETPRIIDFEYVGNVGLPGGFRIIFVRSPVLTLFKWSPIVTGAVEKNIKRMGLSTSLIERQGERTVPITHDLVAIHVRRLDYKHHCQRLSAWGEFEGWNLLDFLPDRFNPPGPPHYPDTNGSATVDLSTDPRSLYLISRCWLEVDQIVKRLAQLKLEYADELQLRKVYISTNDRAEWVDTLKSALLKSGWESVRSTNDLEFTWEESGVDSAVDMELVTRGKVFVGNGFSTFTSTVVSLRLTRDLPSKHIHFW